jgi:hypothetical protein
MAATTVIVRYELKPDRLDEHVGLIDDVFTHLNQTAPPGVHYAAFREADGYTFTHVGHYDSDDARTAASENDAFARFTAAIADRCEVPPAAAPQTVIGSHGAFS